MSHTRDEIDRLCDRFEAHAQSAGLRLGYTATAAFDRCLEVSEAFAAFALEEGFAAGTIQAEWPRWHKTRWGMLWRHVTVWFVSDDGDGFVVDWTAKQIDPNYPHPRIQTGHEFEAEWIVVKSSVDRREAAHA